jgi:beta-lactam-binding protein with PASTA domain
MALRLDVKKERQSRPAQTRVPSLKGMSYEEAETKLHAANLNIRLLATRYDLPLQPGLIIDQTPQPGEEVDYGYAVGVTITKADSHGQVRNGKDSYLHMVVLIELEIEVSFIAFNGPTVRKL